MKKFSKILMMVLAISFIFCSIGFAKDDYSKYPPKGHGYPKLFYNNSEKELRVDNNYGQDFEHDAYFLESTIRKYPNYITFTFLRIFPNTPQCLYYTILASRRSVDGTIYFEVVKELLFNENANKVIYDKNYKFSDFPNRNIHTTEHRDVTAVCEAVWNWIDELNK